MKRVALLTFLLLVTGWTSALAKQPANGPRSKKLGPRDSLATIRAREEWFYRQRSFAPGVNIAAARLHALKQLHAMVLRQATAQALLGSAILTSTASWMPIGPQPEELPWLDDVSGRITAIAFDPQDPATVYAGTADGGVWKTTDGGANWNPLTDTQASLAVGSIAIDPSNPTTIYVGTGEGNFSGDNYYGAGVLKSTDGGSSWTQIAGPFVGPFPDLNLSGNFKGQAGGASIASLAVDPLNSQILLAAAGNDGSTNGVWRSADGGQSWTQILAARIGATGVLFNPINGNAYAAIGFSDYDASSGVYVSTDGGITWTRSDADGVNKFPTTNVGRIILAMAPSNPSILYASVSTGFLAGGGGLLGFYQSADGGQNWAQLTNTPDYCSPQCYYDDAIAVSPTNPDVVVVGGSAGYDSKGFPYGNLLLSTDGGAAWTQVSIDPSGKEVHADVHALTFSPDGSVLYVGTDGGVWSTPNPSTGPIAWTNLNATLSLAQFYAGIAIHPSSEGVALGGTQDNGTLAYAGQTIWDWSTCGDGAWNAFDLHVPTTVYTDCGGGITILKSEFGGAAFSWAQIQGSGSPGQPGNIGIDTTDRHAFNPPLVMDPTTASTLYFGTYRVYQTTDGGSSWSAISPDLTGGVDNPFAVVSSIAVSRSNPNTVYAAAMTVSNQTLIPVIWVTNNANAGPGASWTQISSGLPDRYVTKVIIDPSDASVAYLTFSGFALGGDTLGHIFESADGGVSWSDISGNLPNIPVNDLVIDPEVPGALYVATDIGVFQTSDNGATWSVLGSDLPDAAVLSLELRNESRTLRAGTHGRGAWDLTLANFTPSYASASISPVSTVAAGPSFTLTVNGYGFTAGSAVLWNGVGLSTTFVSSSDLKATVPASDIRAGGTVQITVSDPNLGSTNGLVFTTLNPALNFVPGISPSSATAGSSDIALTVVGLASSGPIPEGFSLSSQVLWNGTPLQTQFVSTTQLTATVPATLLASPGNALVAVYNPPPGGGTSSSATFTISAPAPTVTLNPTSVSFPSQTVDTTSAAEPVTLTNRGTGVLTISGITTTGDFGQMNNCPASLAVNASCTINVTFTPMTTGTLTGALSIADDAPGSPQTVGLTGTGVAATGGSSALTLSTNQLAFGFVIAQGSPLPAGTPTTVETLPITATNTGTAPLTFSSDSFAFSGADPGDFTLDSTQASACSSSASVAPNSSCVLYVVFTPAAASDRSAALTISSNDPAGPKSVSLAGIGMDVFYQFGASLPSPEPGVPPCFDVVSSSVGQSGAGCSAPPSGDTSNEGYETGAYGCALTSTAATLSTFSAYSSTTPASLDTNPPITTYAGDTDPEKGLYSPTGSGEMNWTVVPQFSEACTVSNNVVSGCYSATTGETLDEYLTQHTTQRIQTGKEADRLILQLCEKWLGPCPSANIHYVTTVSPNGSNDWYLFDPGWQTNSTDSPNIYTLSGHEQGFTAAGVFRTFEVTGIKTYSGTAPASSLGIQAQSPVELVVTDSQGRQVGNVSPGVDVAQIPASSYARDFPIGNDSGGTTAIGDPTGVKTVFIPGATGGTYTVAATGTGSGPYTLTFRAVASDGSVQESTFSGTTTPGAVADLQVNYSPAPGASMTLTPLPAVNLSANALALGNELVGSTTQTGSIVIDNSGVGTLIISGVAVSGDFAQTNNCGTSVSPGKTCTVNITFTPTAAGPRTGTLSLSDNAPDSPQTVALSGTGEDFALATDVSSRTIRAGQSAAYTLSVTPEGGFNQAVLLSCEGAPQLSTCTISPTSLALNGSSASTATVTVTTTARGAVPRAPDPPNPPRNRTSWPCVLALLSLMLLAAAMAQKLRLRLSLALAVLCLSLSAGCSGGGAGAPSSTGAGTPTPGTPAGSYSLTVSGSDGGLTHSTTVILTVQ
jgi:photosystem II stability/assembly factor-like uncharacterized protein